MTTINPKLPFWHHQLVLRWHHHQPESHQFPKALVCMYVQRLRPIDRTPGTPGSVKNISFTNKVIFSCVITICSSGEPTAWKHCKTISRVPIRLLFYTGTQWSWWSNQADIVCLCRRGACSPSQRYCWEQEISFVECGERTTFAQSWAATLCTSIIKCIKNEFNIGDCIKGS